MEIFTVIGTIIMSFLSSLGLLLNSLTANAIQTKVNGYEKLEVRISSVPTHKLFTGEIQQLRMATRGLEPIKQLRIDTLELETDVISLNLNNLKITNFQDFQQSLKKPLQAGIRLILTEQDLNKSLQSSEFQAYFQKIIGKSNNVNFQIINPHLDLLANNRLKIETNVIMLNHGQEDTVNTTIEFGLEVIKGSKIKIIEPIGTLNGRQLSRKLLEGFAENISQQLDLQKLEALGITIRLLKFQINDNEINTASFVRIINSNSN